MPRMLPERINGCCGNKPGATIQDEQPDDAPRSRLNGRNAVGSTYRLASPN